MTRRRSTVANPADRVLRVRLREMIHFPDLTERRALKLSAVPHYSSRAHFGVWHRRMAGIDFHQRTGLFTPLVYVEIEATDAPLDPAAGVQVRGETSLACVPDRPDTSVGRLVREGRYQLLARNDGAETLVARSHFINMFTRDDPDPARRRVTSLPADMGLGSAPSRLAVLPSIEAMLPGDRRPDFVEAGARVWHYGQTDPNRHVSGMEYLRLMECYIAEVLQRRGHDMRRAYFARARIVYRKPCFRGEGYRRAAWVCGEAPLVIAGAFYKDGDAAGARPNVAIELTLAQHA